MDVYISCVLIKYPLYSRKIRENEKKIGCHRSIICVSVFDCFRKWAQSRFFGVKQSCSTYRGQKFNMDLWLKFVSPEKIISINFDLVERINSNEKIIKFLRSISINEWFNANDCVNSSFSDLIMLVMHSIITLLRRRFHSEYLLHMYCFLR